MRKKLTAAFCKTATVEEGAARTYYWDAAKPGFYLMVTKLGHRSFGIQYRKNRRYSPRMRIKATSLDAARKEATKLLGEVANGGDPLGYRRKQAMEAEGTFKRVAENFFKREGGKLRSVNQRRSVFERLIYPKFAAWPINDIARSDIAKLLDTIEDENGPVMADRTLAYLGRVFAWHAARDDKFRSPIVRGMARTKAKERARSRILTDDELRALWKAAEASKGPFGPLLQFILLTSARRNEAAHIARSEVVGSLWTLPAARNKVKEDLARPLSSKALALLAELPRIEGCDYFFTANGTAPIRAFADYKARFDRDCGVTGWTIHDLRRTARSLMSRAGVNADIAERALGHVIGGVRGTYDRHKYETEMLHAFEALAGLIERIVDPQDKVLPLRGGVS
jgi:integrase